MKKIKFFLILIMFFIVFIYPYPNMFVSSYNITHGDIDTIYSDNYYDAFPACTNTSNGTWIVTFGYGTYHSDSSMVLKGVRSFDYGQTWSSPFLIRDGSGQTECAAMITAPNGNVVACIMDEGGNDKATWCISTDNGSSWTYKGYIDGGTGKLAHPTGIHIVNNDIYVCGYQFDGGSGYDGHNCSIWRSSDNGNSWSFYSWVDHYNANDEWDFFPLNNTHWIALFREYPDTENGAWQAESFDAGLTWTNFTNRQNFFGGGLHLPKLHWLNEDKKIILLTGRVYNKTTGYIATKYWISDDNGTTWQNATTIVDGSLTGAGGDDMGYTDVIQEDARAYMVYYNGKKVNAPSSDCPDIYGIWIYDNTSYNGGSSNVNPYFVDINEQTNNTILTTGVRWGNATRYNSSDYSGDSVFLGVNSYEIQIANDSGFVDVFANVTGINNTY
ncbi:MAG: hypothetical protein DRN24_06840, partial [Thermoplasmata archaeon]